MFNSTYDKLSRAFFLRSNVVEIAHDLVGKYLVTGKDHTLTVGRIVETEAYDGRKDHACHAYRKVTPRTEVMYREGGTAYVYLCYGIHKLFNIVTNVEGKAGAVLIRAVEPIKGIKVMRERRGNLKNPLKLTAGPGSLTVAMGIDLSYNKSLIGSDTFFIANGEKRNIELETDRRVGVDYAGKDAALPWRFFEIGNKYVSKPKQKPIEHGVNN